VAVEALKMRDMKIQDIKMTVIGDEDMKLAQKRQRFEEIKKD